jgi:hypothetical protein
MAIWTEWDKLTDVIVGDCPTHCDYNFSPAVSVLFNQILSETKEDLNNLSNLFTKLGVKVRRPNILNKKVDIEITDFNINYPVFPIIPRDQYLVYGETIYQTYTSMPERYLDSLSYNDIFLDLFKEGHNWLSQPPPLLKNLPIEEEWWIQGLQRYQGTLKDKLLWHTATMFKCGDSVITNHQGPGTQYGLEWMKRNIDAKIIHNENAHTNGWGHIDHGFFMTDDDTVFAIDESWLPHCLKNKNVIIIGDLVELMDYSNFVESYKTNGGKKSADWLNMWMNEWKGYMQDVCFDTNVLIVDSKNIIFSNEQPKLFKLLNGMGISCHVSKIRHGAFWESGIHCMTLDVKREGNKRSVC